jgi:predicted dehydrogenase
MNKIRLAVIGTGMAWDRLHLPAIQELADKYEVVAMANPTREKLEKAADKIGLSHDNIYQDYQEMLKRNDIDVVNIVVPITLNYKVSEDTAKAGKNIICEKPLGANMEEAAAFSHFSSKYNIKVMIAENYRYNEENNIIRNLINEKRIGDIVYFIKNNISNFPEEMKKNTFAAKEWRQHPDYPGGAFLDAGVHDLAALRYIFGDVEMISAFGKPSNQEFIPYQSIHSSFRFQSGVIGHYIYWPSGIESQKPAVGFRIFGTQGMIYLEEKTCGMVNVFYNDGNHEIIHYTPARGYYNEFLNFYHVLKGTEQVHVPPQIEYGDTKLVFDILDAIQNQKVISASF